MNIKDFKASLDYLFKAEVTAFVWGDSGKGKSTVVKQYAQDKGYKFFPLYLGTQSDLGDILGLASFVKDENGSEIATTFATPIWMKDMIDYCNENPDSGAIIFLDEFNRARRDILSGMFSLALDKTFHNIRLPKNCHIIAAGNPPTDEYIVTDVNDTALMARFAHIKLEPTVAEWLTYARDAGFEPTLVSFIQDQPDLLEDHKSTFTLPVKVDRRSFERVNKLFKVGTPMPILEQLMMGIIGTERLVNYKLHLTNIDKPLSGDQVLKGQNFDLVREWSNPTSTANSMLSTTCDNVFDVIKDLSKTVKEMEDSQCGHFVAFLEIIPKDLAFALLKKLNKEDFSIFKSLARNNKYEERIIALTKVALGKK